MTALEEQARLEALQRTQDLDAERPVCIAEDARHQRSCARDPNFACVLGFVRGGSVDGLQGAVKDVLLAIDGECQMSECSMP
jgi:hypothetical protein